MDMYKKREMRKNKKINENNEVFPSLPISWYPGHMAKTKRQIAENLKLVDIVIEILDSRIPISSQNPDIQEIIKNKQKIIVLNKSDLADEKQNKLWINYFEKKGQKAVLAACNKGNGINEILKSIENLKQKEIELYNQKGRVGRKIRAMVIRNSKLWKIFFYK